MELEMSKISRVALIRCQFTRDNFILTMLDSSISHPIKALRMPTCPTCNLSSILLSLFNFQLGFHLSQFMDEFHRIIVYIIVIILLLLLLVILIIIMVVDAEQYPFFNGLQFSVIPVAREIFVIGVQLNQAGSNSQRFMLDMI